MKRLELSGRILKGLWEAVEFAKAVEEGRGLARDVGACDPERMTSLKAAQYIEDYFKGQTGVNCSIVKGTLKCWLRSIVADGSSPCQSASSPSRSLCS